ncbi:MAG: hypothetical protein H0W99_12835 [Acidobacteria bacterium]|nr:hypothetical protein [Acidobacteriota bacterium]
MTKRMNKLMAFGAALVLGVSVFAQQQSQTGNQPQQPTKQGGQMMSMDDMMKGCKEHCQKTMTSIDQTTTTMAQARQSNDPAQMRSALEQGEKSLTEMKDHMSMCMNMMGNMNMDGMMNKTKRTTKGHSKKSGMKPNQ